MCGGGGGGVLEVRKKVHINGGCMRDMPETGFPQT